MPTTIIYDRDNGAVLALDPQRDAEGNPILPSGVNAGVLDLSDTEAAKLREPGSFTVTAAGVVTVTPPGPEQPSVVEFTAARTDLRDQYLAALTRLDQIIGATSPTNAQVVQAVRDIATIQRRTLRYLYAETI